MSLGEIDDGEFGLNVPSIDVYVTYKCGLRCDHCFVGESLDLGTHFDFASLQGLLTRAPAWGAKEITFLGGEPTCYLHIEEAVKMVRDLGMHPRLVTNGQSSFQRFLEGAGRNGPLSVYMSVDGSSPIHHDKIRGRGTFKKLMKSVELTSELNIPTAGILSIQRSNVDDAVNVLKLCADLGFQHVNVHYVTSRGFAAKESVLNVDEWHAVVSRIDDYSTQLPMDIRVERTFAEPTEVIGGCSVVNRDNLMVFPDGRVFMCAMFFDAPNAHSFTWTGSGLIPNDAAESECRVCSCKSDIHCPAMKLVNPEIAELAESRKLRIRCIYDKSRVRKGAQVADTSS